VPLLPVNNRALSAKKGPLCHCYCRLSLSTFWFLCFLSLRPPEMSELSVANWTMDAYIFGKSLKAVMDGSISAKDDVLCKCVEQLVQHNPNDRRCLDLVLSDL
jgi:hypothetical protein